jgi:LysM repeat protein
MDNSSPSKTGSYLVIVVGFVAVIAFVLAIVSFTKVKKLSAQLGTVPVGDIAQRMDQVEQTAKAASTAANEAKTRFTGLSTDTQRAFDQVTSEFSSLRTTVNRLSTDLQAISDRPSGSPAPRPAAAGPSGPAPGSLSADGVYVIKNGDTLARIGAEFGVSWQEIMRVNPGVNPNRLRIGQEILIPIEDN